MMFSPLLPESTTKTIKPVIDLVQQNEQKIQDLFDQIQNLKPKPEPTPTVNPDIAALQEQLRVQSDLIKKLWNPPSPVQVIPQPVLTSAIKAVDSSGKPIPGNQVTAGQMFQIVATESGTWTVIKSADADVDAKVYGNEVACVLRAGASVTVVHSSGSPITTSSIIVKCLNAPQPPPQTVDVKPVDVKPVDIKPVVEPPKPVPASSDLRVVIVFESSQNHSREQLNILSSTAIVEALDRKCVQDAGIPSWRRWDKDKSTDSEQSAAMKALWSKVLPEAKSIGLPAIAVACGADVRVRQLPTKESEVLAMLECGGN